MTSSTSLAARASASRHLQVLMVVTLIQGGQGAQALQFLRNDGPSPRLPAERHACGILPEPPMILPLKAWVTKYNDLSQISQFFDNTPVKLHADLPSRCPQRVRATPFPDGRGFARAAHGWFFRVADHAAEGIRTHRSPERIWNVQPLERALSWSGRSPGP